MFVDSVHPGSRPHRTYNQISWYMIEHKSLLDMSRWSHMKSSGKDLWVGSIEGYWRSNWRKDHQQSQLDSYIAFHGSLFHTLHNLRTGCLVCKGLGIDCWHKLHLIYIQMMSDNQLGTFD